MDLAGHRDTRHKRHRPAKSLAFQVGVSVHALLRYNSAMANQRARELRKSMSNAERRLWSALRLRQLDGARFRRQHPIGRYIVDFVCLEKRLIVEVDGPQHAEEAHVARDERRDRWLIAEGYRVMRFQTIDVYQNLGGVADTIWAALQE